MASAAWFPAVISGGSQIAASGAGRRRGRRFARKEAEKNRAFQRQQSGSIYQRGVRDMRKAGINPILMASGGFGAKAAAGGMQAPTDQSVDVGGAISSAASAAMIGLQVRKGKAEVDLLKQQEDTSWYLGNESYHRGRANLGNAAKGELLREFYTSDDGKKLARRAEYMNAYGGAASAAASAAGSALKFVPGPAGSLMRGRFQ